METLEARRTAVLDDVVVEQGEVPPWPFGVEQLTTVGTPPAASDHTTLPGDDV